MLSTDLSAWKSDVDSAFSTAIARASAFESDPTKKSAVCAALDSLLDQLNAKIAAVSAAKVSVPCDV